MDYDTFVNSAFIQQGRADMFTTNPPSKRLAEKASGLTREWDASVRLLEAELGNIDQELSHKQEYQGRRNNLEEELSALETEVKTRDARLEELQG